MGITLLFENTDSPRASLAWSRALSSSGLLLLTLFSGCFDPERAEVPPAHRQEQTSATLNRFPALSATLAGCGDTKVHDNGQLVYLIANADCTPEIPLRVRLELRTRHGIRSIVVSAGNWGLETPIEIPLFGSRLLSVFRAGSWRSFPNENSWAPRDGAGLLAKNGRLYLLGGWLHGPLTNEVWVSDNARDWTFLGFAPWSGRHGAAWLVHDDRLYVIGGEMTDDVWSSADGETWTRMAEHAPFRGRYTPNAASLGDDIYVYAGLVWEPHGCTTETGCTPIGPRDIWKSRDGGRTWQMVDDEAPWQGRALIHGSTVFDGKIHLLGGGLKGNAPGARYAETTVEYAEVWSSADGIEWHAEPLDLPFPARTHFSVVADETGCYLSDGSVGTQVNVSAELYFAADCKNFSAVENPPLQPRHASSLVNFNGSLVILGGPPVGDAGTVVWQYFP